MKVFRQQLDLAKFIIMPEIFKLVAESPTSRFWVSGERAAIVIAAIDAGKTLQRMRPTKREMFEEIYRRFLVERDKAPDKSLYEIVSYIVLQPAPKFYLTPRTAGEIIKRIKNGWYDRQYDRYRQFNSGKRQT